MFLEFIIVIFLTRYLRKTLETSSKLPAWDRILRITMYVAAILLAVQFSIPAISKAVEWVAHILLLLLLTTIYRKDEFKTVRWAINAVLPFVIVSIFSDFISLLPSKLYDAIRNFEEPAFAFSIIWMIAMFFVARKQRNALEKERKIRLAEEEQNKIIAARKTELESLVAERTSELTQQKDELQHALTELKSTQVQLIQQEKMASLGELTAGIAHEIQNPLNFVNNFSELSIEIAQELKEEVEKQMPDKALISKLVTDLSQNQEKINHHGRRADAIVKGMLQHSRSNTGKKEPTDINALADEYLRLSYHGLRAKDKQFNAAMKTSFDETIGKINIVPQDMGRVLLNLFNNAFYAVAEKKKMLGETFAPTVSVSTKKLGNKIEIRAKDNGMGIDEKVLDKIFQPFFTTKPPGQGTGLGLSLSYDIIKAHGGNMKVENKKGEYAEFVIQIPLKENPAHGI